MEKCDLVTRTPVVASGGAGCSSMGYKAAEAARDRTKLP
jgi:hypothetical protein